MTDPENRDPRSRPVLPLRGDPMPAVAAAVAVDDARPLTTQQARHLVDALEAAAGTTRAAHPHPRHGWSFIDDAGARNVVPEVLLAAAQRLDAAVGAVRGVAAAAEIDRVSDPADLVAAARVIAFPHVFPIDTVERAADARWRAAGAAAIASLRAFSSAEHAVLGDLDRSGLDLPLEQLRREAQAAVDGAFLGRTRRLRAVATRFGPALGTGARAALLQLPQLAQAAIDVRTARDAATHAVFSVPGLTADAGDPFDPAWPDRLDARRAALIELADLRSAVSEASPLRPLVEDVLRRRTTRPEGLPALLTALADAIGGVRQQLGAEPRTWLAGEGWTAAWRATAEDRALAGSGATTLRRWLDHLAGLHPLHDLAGTPRLRSLYEDVISGSLPMEDAPDALELAVGIPSGGDRAAAEPMGTSRARGFPTAPAEPGCGRRRTPASGAHPTARPPGTR